MLTEVADFHTSAAIHCINTSHYLAITNMLRHIFVRLPRSFYLLWKIKQYELHTKFRFEVVKYENRENITLRSQRVVCIFF